MIIPAKLLIPVTQEIQRLQLMAAQLSFSILPLTRLLHGRWFILFFFRHILYGIRPGIGITIRLTGVPGVRSIGIITMGIITTGIIIILDITGIGHITVILTGIIITTAAISVYGRPFFKPVTQEVITGILIQDQTWRTKDLHLLKRNIQKLRLLIIDYHHLIRAELTGLL